MKVLNLKSRNFMGIVAIDITPTPEKGMVVINGKNGAGKTSALDSLWYTLCWKAGSKGTPMPIREGEKFAEAQVTLCEDLTEEQIKQGVKPKPLFIVTRKWTTNDNTVLKVTNAEGLTYATPQKLLDGFIGYLSFDPREFLKMSGKEQRELLIKITGYDFTKIETRIAELREERRLQSQTVKLLSGEREEITIESLPEREILTSKLNEELEKAINHNQEIQGAKEKIEREEDQIEKAEVRIENLRKEITLLKEAVGDTKNEMGKGKKYLEGNETIDTSLIRGRIEEAQKINLQIMARERNREADKKQKEAQGVYDKYTKGIEDNEKEREEGLKASWSKIPDQGLSLTETGIAYNGIPFSQIAYSKGLIIAIRLAMALNPKLRVIFISDYSLLDNESQEAVQNMSKDEGYQVWTETVDVTPPDRPKVGFYIEEGKLKSIDGEIAEPPRPIIGGKEEKGKVKKTPKNYERRAIEEE